MPGPLFPLAGIPRRPQGAHGPLLAFFFALGLLIALRNWRRPTTDWEVGEVIMDEYNLPIRPEAPAGRYTIFVGMYDPATMRRLPLRDEAGHRLPDDRLPLATATVTR